MNRSDPGAGKTLLAAGLAGALFGAGLVISGMSDPQKVLAFLDVLGAWDPSLMVVMATALVTAFIGYRLVWRRSRPSLDSSFHLPQAKAIDARLVMGAALFGVGWGLAGYCPGPALTALLIAPLEALWFVGAMVAGMSLFRVLDKRRP